MVRPLRLWPGVAIVAVELLVRFGLPVVAPGIGAFAGLSGPFALLLVIIWWLCFSRAAWVERVGAIVAMIAGLALTPYLLHESVRTGNLGFQFFIHSPAPLSIAFVAWAVLTRNRSDALRRTTMVATILLACGSLALLRSKGLTGEGSPEFTWRWAESAEQRLLERGEERTVPVMEPEAIAGDVDWPGFRGPGRDGIVRGLRIATDWSASPPLELWRRPVGPGVSSFAVCDDLLFTEEQRGDDEIVAAYRVETGEPVWRHRDAVRFQDSHVGAGPRATPTCDGDHVYSLGGTGIVNALDVIDGSVLWQRDGAADTGRKVPEFGFTGSPLLVDDRLVVAVSGRLAAYDRATGEPRWLGPERGGGYSSPQLLTIDGAAQVLLLSGAGVTSVAPSDGGVLWQRDGEGSSYLQPALTSDGDLLIAEIDFMPLGMLRLAVHRGPAGFTVEDRFRSTDLKAHFSDFVVHEGHVYGFDGGILACIDSAHGARRWKGGRYGHGQLLLLDEQNLLLVLSEQGDLALVAATPDGFRELGRSPAIRGRTWNHPALAGDVLLVRNSEEMAAFRLQGAVRTPPR